MRYLVILILLPLGLVACSPTSALNTMVPAGSYEVHQDIAYAADERQRMDIYMPSQGPLHTDIIMFVYGGSWEDGDKQDFEFIGQAFARLGYVTVIPNYRLYPQAEFPEFINDVAKALGAVPDQIDALRTQQAMPTGVEQCPSGRNVILAGHSAGAHTAALIATDPQYLERHAPNVQLSALIGLAGPYDLPLQHERVKDKFTRVEGDEANPIALASEATPQTLLIHGESDTVAKPEHAAAFANKLEELGVHVTLKTYPRRRHVDLVASLASPLRFWTPAYNDIQTFLAERELNRSCAG